MKKFLLGLAIVMGFGAVGLTLLAAQYEPKIPAGVKIGGLAVGEMTRGQASYRLRQWWEQERKSPVTLQLEGSNDSFTTSATQLGLSLDDVKTTEVVDTDTFFEGMKRSIMGTRESHDYALVFKATPPDLSKLAAFVEERVPDRKPARVTYQGGNFNRTPETAGFTLDKSKVYDAALAAFTNSETGQIPVIVDKKKVPDDELLDINEIRSEFTTRFSTGKVSRTNNIRLAAKAIDGLVLAPGEQFSFNKTVGRRTVEGGFMVAGVYKNGKHDVDIGGGICQVSTTLYNASLFANLKIVRRSNHSMPVPYVPLGRDATVDYGSADLMFENNTDKPIAVSSSVSGGQVTFRILGKKDSETTIKLVSGPSSSWDVGVKQQPDPSLPAGRTKVIEKGSRGHRIATYRVVYQNGQEIKREPLGQSVYRGGKRIILVGTAIAPSPQPSPLDEVPPPSNPIETEHDGF